MPANLVVGQKSADQRFAFDDESERNDDRFLEIFHAG